MILSSVKITTAPFNPPTALDGVELGGPAEIIAPFDDRWCCAMCRDVQRICEFHQSMEADGYKPPKSFASLL